MQPFDRLDRWRAARRQDHAVVFGDSALAAAIARQQAKSRPVTCVGRRAVEGCLTIAPGDDVGACVADVACAQAGLVVVDCATDIATLALLQTLRGRLAGIARRPAIVVHVRSAPLRQAAIARLEAEGEGSVALFGLGATIAGATVRRERLFDRAWWRGQPRVHALIIGFTPAGRACLEEAIFAGIAGQLAPPRITLLADDAVAVRAELAAAMPEIGQSAEIEVAALDTACLADARSGAVIQADDVAPVTAIFICLADEAAAIGAMQAIAALQRRTGRALGPVHLLAEQDMPAARAARPIDRPGDDARRFIVTAGVPEDDDLLDLLTARGDVTAERLHDAYRHKFGAGLVSGVEWQRLPETYRAANRRTAQHLPQKLWTAGLTGFGCSPDAAAVAPAAFETVIRPTSESASEDALLRRLARLEHDRWNADRRVDGWAYSPTRDDARRLHHNLVSFDDPRFTDHDIAKDIQQIKFLFTEVVRPDANGATVPVIVGVVAGEAGRDGVDEAAADALLANASWRPVQIVCGLIDEAQCAAVARLMSTLDSAGRGCELIVPEIRPDNRGLRSADGAAVVALTGRAGTRIMPIGVPEQPGDEWADPEAPGGEHKVLERYIRDRATAVIAAGRAPR